MNRYNLALILVLVIFGLGIFSSLTFEAIYVYGLNVSNTTLKTKVNVTNTEPDLYNVSIISFPIDLNAGNTTLVNCTGSAYDTNGWEGIVKVNASFYFLPFGYNSNPTTADKNYRYFNTSCNCTQLHASYSTNASCSCTFLVQYYAYNGTWECNMTIADSGRMADSMESQRVQITETLGIEIPNIHTIDYGNLTVTEISRNITANVSNLGNIPINVSIRGWGGSQGYSAPFNDTTMLCEIGNITVGYQRYAIDPNMGFPNMYNLTNNSIQIPDFYLPSRTNDTHRANDTNSTYWALEIPPNIAGVCNGTVEFTAIQRDI